MVKPRARGWSGNRRNGGRSAPIEIVGESPEIREIRSVIDLVGPTDVSVLIIGEPGTGKEIVAQALHAASGRNPLIARTCAAIPSGLAASALFGHVKGAFTGADRNEPGFLRSAASGTLFLDEVGELPGDVQPKLLRALDPGEFSPVGSLEVYRTECRILAATNQSVRITDDASPLREDLLSRLGAIVIRIPPLRSRRGDITILVESVLGATPIELEALDLLERHSWTRGNIRELKSTLKRAEILAGEGTICPEHLMQTAVLPGGIPTADPDDLTLNSRRLEDVKIRHARKVFEETGRNLSAAARVLDIDRKTLRRLLGPQAPGN